MGIVMYCVGVVHAVLKKMERQEVKVKETEENHRTGRAGVAGKRVKQARKAREEGNREREIGWRLEQVHFLLEMSGFSGHVL